MTFIGEARAEIAKAAYRFRRYCGECGQRFRAFLGQLGT